MTPDVSNKRHMIVPGGTHIIISALNMVYVQMVNVRARAVTMLLAEKRRA